MEMHAREEQARQLLRTGFIVAPLVAGFDKFFEKTAIWEEYLSPMIAKRVPVSPRTFMKFVGVVEITAGLLVATKPRFGAAVVSAWLAGITANLVSHPRRYLDIALRDVGLALGALALSRLEGDRYELRHQERPLLPPKGARPAVPMPERMRPTLEEPVHA